MAFTKHNTENTAFEWRDEHIEQIIEHPHLLGHICGKNKLTELHSEWISKTWGDAFQSSAIQAHRGSYKTTSIVVIGCIWWLLFHPDDRIAIIRKTFTDASQVTESIKLIFNLPEVSSLFRYAHGFIPKLDIKQSGRLRFNFKTTITPEASITAHGLDYGITGKHYDRIVMDDFVTLKDRVSKAERERTKEMVQEIAGNVIDAGKPMIYIGTPWHRDDAWNLPTIPQLRKWDVYTTGILNEKEIEDKRQKLNPSLFAANYELLHKTPENMLFVDPVYGEWENYSGIYTVAHVDGGYDGDHYCALTIMSKTRGGKLQAIGFVFPGNVLDWLPFIKLKYKEFECRQIYMETNADKGYISREMKKRGMTAITYAESQNKHIKISTHLYQYWRDIIWDGNTEDEFMEQILDYREGVEPNDAPDSVASLLREFFIGGGFNEALYRW